MLLAGENFVEKLSSWSEDSAISTDSFNVSGIIKFIEEQIWLLYANPIWILSEGDQKFDSAEYRDYATIASIGSK